MKFAETSCQNCGASKHDVEGDEIDNVWRCHECIALDDGEDEYDKDNYLNYTQDL